MKTLLMMAMVATVTAVTMMTASPAAHASFEEPAVVRVSDGTRLKGRWMLPDGDVRAVALVLQGSGNVGMDGDVSSPLRGHPRVPDGGAISRQLARALARIGVATLRYDKRGVDDRSEVRRQIPSVLAHDALDAATFARRRFPGAGLFIVGFDEGAYLGMLVARRVNVDALFLLGLPTRTADEVFRYQFAEWPLRVYRKHLAADDSGKIALTEFRARGLDRLIFSELAPSLNRPLEAFDLDKDAKLSVAELGTAYAQAWTALEARLESPAYAAWYHDLKGLPAARDIAGELRTPLTYLYMGLDDAEADPSWYQDDLRRFSGVALLRAFPGLGHCFSPMAGTIGQVKTTGPIDAKVLSRIVKDVSGLVPRPADPEEF